MQSVAASPDGRAVSYVRWNRNGTSATVEIASLRTRRSRTLTTAARPLYFAPATWSANGRWVAFPSNDLFTWVVRPDGTQSHRLPVSGGQFSARHYSPNGRCLVGTAALAGADKGQIALVAATGGALTSVPVSIERFELVEAVQFTPDGRRITFLAGESWYRAAAYSVNLDGTGLRKLTPVGSFGSTLVFSPDGRLMAYGDKRGTMVRRASGGPARRLLTGSWVKAWAPRR